MSITICKGGNNHFFNTQAIAA